MELALYPTTQQRQGCSGVVADTNPVGDATIPTAMTSCLQQQNIVLDDGYGSSNSSPHSSGTVKHLWSLSRMCSYFIQLEERVEFVVQSDGGVTPSHISSVCFSHKGITCKNIYAGMWEIKQLNVVLTVRPWTAYKLTVRALWRVPLVKQSLSAVSTAYMQNADLIWTDVRLHFIFLAQWSD
jgi:hypothetical protein